MTWKAAFLKQARSEMSQFRRVAAEGPRCFALYFLASAGEKTVKARSEEAKRNETPALTHKGLRQHIIELSLSPRLLARLGYDTPAEFRRAKQSLVDTAAHLEGVIPKIANDRRTAEQSHTEWTGLGTNAEYPWMDGSAVIAPCDYAFDEPPLRPVRLEKFAVLLDALIESGLAEVTDRVS